MAYEITFFDEYYSMKLINRLKFFLLIWFKGKFQSDIVTDLELSPTESIIKYAQMIQKLGFLSIEKGINASSNHEYYYFISDDNFKNIFLYLCEKARIQFNPEAFELAYSERVNIHPLMDEKINNKIDFDESLDQKELIAILSKNLAFFFLFIMSTSLKIKNNEYFNDLINLFTGNDRFDVHQIFQYLSI